MTRSDARRNPHNQQSLSRVLIGPAGDVMLPSSKHAKIENLFRRGWSGF
jgi:hypothetical protein